MTLTRKTKYAAGGIIVGLVLVAGILAVGYLAVLLGGQTVGSIGGPRVEDDPLTADEVREELQKLPMDYDEFFSRLNSKQNYFKNYGREGEPFVNKDAATIDRIFELAAGTGRLRFAPGADESTVVGVASAMSWDSRARAEGGIHRTGNWRLLLDKNNVIVGYIAAEE